MENRFNGFFSMEAETVRNGSRIDSVDLYHRAEAKVLMRSLRVIQGVARFGTRSAGMTETLSEKQAYR